MRTGEFVGRFRRSEPVALDRGAGRAREVALAEQGGRGHPPAPGLRLRARRARPAAPSRRARGRSRRAAARREEVRRHSGISVLRQTKPMTDPANDGFRTVGQGGAVPEGFVVSYYFDDRKHRVSVARVGGHLYAFDDLCTCAHEACPLSGGLLTGTAIQCQCHGSRFDVTTGAVLRGPASEPLSVHEVTEADGRIRIRLATAPA